MSEQNLNLVILLCWISYTHSALSRSAKIRSLFLPVSYHSLTFKQVFNTLDTWSNSPLRGSLVDTRPPELAILSQIHTSLQMVVSLVPTRLVVPNVEVTLPL